MPKQSQNLPKTVPAKRSRSINSYVLPAFCAMLLFGGFVALGTWQIKRLYWKRALIERVEQRVHAPAVAAPERVQWNDITAESDEYRHVRVSGDFLDDHSIKVVASTVLGRGFWLMTPLRLANGNIIFINRGFIAYNSKPCLTSINTSGHTSLTEITGLLRISEPGGALVRSNNPARQQWYSRDVAALAASKHLSNVAPFFIDADKGKISNPNQANKVTDCQDPVAGLTVIAFPNNHLLYALTWYTLGFMVMVVCFIFGRAELRLRAADSA